MAEPADGPRSLVARRLLRVFDVRPRDPITGERPTAAEYKAEVQAPLCVRCGREHVKVYEVECDDGKPYTVGSGCVGRTFGGWEPDKAEITRARSAVAKARKVAEEAARKAWIAAAVQRVLGVCPAMPAAPPVVLSAPPYAHLRESGDELATMGDTSQDPFASGVFVYLPTRPPESHDTGYLQRARAERLRHLRSSWEGFAAKQCMEQAGAGASPGGAPLTWHDSALTQWGIPQHVASAVQQAWGGRR